jgi:hypothetical protein
MVLSAFFYLMAFQAVELAPQIFECPRRVRIRKGLELLRSLAPTAGLRSLRGKIPSALFLAFRPDQFEPETVRALDVRNCVAIIPLLSSA